jgi:hypothetical protein
VLASDGVFDVFDNEQVACGFTSYLGEVDVVLISARLTSS